MRKIIIFFDKLEDRARGWFSRHPILYGFMGGIGVVLFWRGVWYTADWVSGFLMDIRMGNPSINLETFPDGPLSFLLGSLLLLITGLFVSSFVGNQIIISGIKGEKKIEEKTEAEVLGEAGQIRQIKSRLMDVLDRLDQIEERLGK